MSGAFGWHERLSGWAATCGGERCGSGLPRNWRRDVVMGLSQPDAIGELVRKGWLIQEGCIRCPDCAMQEVATS